MSHLYITIYPSGLRPDRCGQQADLLVDSFQHAALHSYFVACIISMARFCREAAAGEIQCQIYLKNTFLKAYFKESATALFRAEWDSACQFWFLFEGFFFGGGTPETSGVTFGTLLQPQGHFLNAFGRPRGITLGSFGRLWGALGAPLDMFFGPRHHQETEKLTQSLQNWC